VQTQHASMVIKKKQGLLQLVGQVGVLIMNPKLDWGRRNQSK
jgi:hypothetical protein